MGRSAEFEATPDIHPFPSTPEEMHAMLRAEGGLKMKAAKYGHPQCLSAMYRTVEYDRFTVGETMGRFGKPLETTLVPVFESEHFESRWFGRTADTTNVFFGIPSERMKRRMRAA